MQSPFPGMDPYLEHHWGDVHHNLISFAEGWLNERLPRDLRARAQERIVVALPGEDREYYPDVRVAEHDRPKQGRIVAAYGAPAKGNTLLNYCGIDATMIPYTVDRNECKVGLYTPGMHIPVRPVSVLQESQPDDVLILAWNFAGEIMNQQAGYRARGGRFITPVPEPVVH